MTHRLRVLVADDDPLVRTGLRGLFRPVPELEVVAEAADGLQAMRLIEAARAEVLLSDVRMKVSGLAVIAPLRERYPHLRIVLMSTAVGEDFREHALNLGAHDFVHKSASLNAFLEALTGVPRQEGRRQSILSNREAAIAERAAQGASNAEIAAALSLSINSVKTYVSRVMSKLGVTNRVQLANLLNKSR